MIHYNWMPLTTISSAVLVCGRLGRQSSTLSMFKFHNLQFECWNGKESTLTIFNSSLGCFRLFKSGETLFIVSKDTPTTVVDVNFSYSRDSPQNTYISSLLTNQFILLFQQLAHWTILIIGNCLNIYFWRKGHLIW